MCINDSSLEGRPTDWQTPSNEELQSILDGYEVLGLLGRGGMGAVYKARQLSLDRPVAIKILPPPHDADDRLRSTRRFEQEARTMARMNHPGIVTVYDFGRTKDDAFFYIVLELVDGTDLARAIHGSDRLPQEDALKIVRSVCETLAYAHSHGIVHRDIKPANILIDSAGQIKVTDFGLAKIVDPSHVSDLSLTRSNVGLGTPDFAAPEVLMHEGDADARADIYSVGVMLYQMLTGIVPRGLFKMPSQKCPELDDRFDRIICKAMEPDREDRYQTAEGITRDLNAIEAATMARRPDTGEPPTGKLRKFAPAILAASLFPIIAFHTFAPEETENLHPAAPTIVDVNALPENKGNIASEADISSNDDSFGLGFPIGNATDGKVCGLSPVDDRFHDDHHTIFDSFGSVQWGPYSRSANELRLKFATPVDLSELVAYVTSSTRNGPEDADRVVTNVSFWVEAGEGLQQAGTATPGDTDEIAGFDRVSIRGSWNDVSLIVFVFTPLNASQNVYKEVRVAEVLALEAEH